MKVHGKQFRKVNPMNSKSIAATNTESTARTSLERTAGTTFTDSEWRLHRDRLLAYIQLLRSWDASRGQGRRPNAGGSAPDADKQIANDKPPTRRTS